MFVLIASSDINSFTDLYDINNIYRKIINFTASMDNLEQQKIQSYLFLHMKKIPYGKHKVMNLVLTKFTSFLLIIF